MRPTCRAGGMLAEKPLTRPCQGPGSTQQPGAHLAQHHPSLLLHQQLLQGNSSRQVLQGKRGLSGLHACSQAGHQQRHGLWPPLPHARHLQAQSLLQGPLHQHCLIARPPTQHAVQALHPHRQLPRHHPLPPRQPPPPQPAPQRPQAAAAGLSASQAAPSARA